MAEWEGFREGLRALEAEIGGGVTAAEAEEAAAAEAALAKLANVCSVLQIFSGLVLGCIEADFCKFAMFCKILAGSFSAASKPIFASACAFFSVFQDL